MNLNIQTFVLNLKFSLNHFDFVLIVAERKKGLKKRPKSKNKNFSSFF
jgi:hypothetical protein